MLTRYHNMNDADFMRILEQHADNELIQEVCNRIDFEDNLFNKEATELETIDCTECNSEIRIFIRMNRNQILDITTIEGK